jgi:sulfur transfer complex TusBCD TusB component (DsrH family)
MCAFIVIICVVAAIFISLFVYLISVHKIRIDRNSPYPVFEIVKVRNGQMKIDMRDVDILWTHRGDTLYLTKNGTYLLFTNSAYGNTFEAVSKERAKQYIMQTRGIPDAIKIFPEIKEEMDNFKNEI